MTVHGYKPKVRQRKNQAAPGPVSPAAALQAAPGPVTPAAALRAAPGAVTPAAALRAAPGPVSHAQDKDSETQRQSSYTTLHAYQDKFLPDEFSHYVSGYDLTDFESMIFSISSLLKFSSLST
jgi:3-oxoacyl-ACP reductase-like protein